MPILLILLAIGGAELGPIDGFRANFLSIRAKVDFTCEFGRIDSQAIEKDRIWSITEPELVVDPQHTVRGRWECDGLVEHYVCRPLDDVWKQRSRPKHASEITWNSPFEVLLDGEIMAFHLFPSFPSHRVDKEVVVMQAAYPSFLASGYGPFLWGDLFPLPKSLNAKFPGVRPIRKDIIRGGHPTEAEIYLKDTPDGGWYRVQVCYDPSIGYLPRFTRAISLFERNGFIKETYLIDAKLCKAGGFVPTKWYEKNFTIKEFEESLPNYDDRDILSVPTNKVSFTHFRVTDFEDLTTPPMLDESDGIRSLASHGGNVVSRSDFKQLTLNRVKTLLGKKIQHPPAEPTLPGLDEAELNRFEAAPRGSWSPLTIAGVVALVFISLGLVLGKRLSNLFTFLVALPLVIGCGHRERPSHSPLTASIEPSEIVFDPGVAKLPLTLVVRNEGNSFLNIKSADGGCTCRKIDSSLFPFLLGPGRAKRLQIDVSDRRYYERQHLNFAFETNRGGLRPISWSSDKANH